MGVLEQVTKLKSEGKSDVEIRDALAKQKISPREIRDALNHLDIKNAVSNTAENQGGMQDPPSPSQDGQDPGQSEQAGQDTYAPQLPQPNPNQPAAGQYSQQDYGQEQGGYGNNYGQGGGYGGYPQENQGPQSYNQGQQAPAQGDYYQQPYDTNGYDQGGYAPETGNDTMVEISEQVFEEKSREMAKKMDSLEEFKNLSQAKLDRLSERIKRIESVIDRLQSAILERVGSYGRDLGSIKNEMSMMQDTFARTMSQKGGSKSAESKEKPKRAEKK